MTEHSCRPATRCERVPTGLVCVTCGQLIACVLCWLDDPDEGQEGTPQQATEWHVDYAVCDKHLPIAVDNVASRSW